MRVLIVDYGMGNVASVKKILDFIGLDSVISNKIEDFEESDFIILPGVGSFKQGMENLINLGLVPILNSEIIDKKKPFLGICLGMQLIADLGTENGITEGLGWVKGKVIKLENSTYRVPHLGWNNLIIKENDFFSSFNNKDFYFIHSYHFDVENSNDVAAYVNYDNNYVAAVQKGNIIATQFHPEKSQKEGIAFIMKVINQYA